MTDNELEQRITNRNLTENQLMAEMIADLLEVKRRGLHLKKSSSMYLYLVSVHGMSNNKAFHYSQAVDLAVQVPEVVEKVKDGELSLGQLTMVQRADLPIEQKQEILEKIEKATAKETEVILEQATGKKTRKDKTTHHADGSVTLQVTLSKETYEKLKRCEELLFHQAQDFDQLLNKMSEIVITAKDPAKPKRKLDKEVNKAQVRRIVFQRDRCCQWELEDGSKCQSRHQLQIDHIKPKHQGGTDELSNLRVLCAQHNRFYYRQEKDWQT